MGCEECDKAQNKGLHTFVRVGTANILVSGCEEHLKEMISQLRRGYNNDSE